MDMLSLGIYSIIAQLIRPLMCPIIWGQFASMCLQGITGVQETIPEERK